MKSFEITYLNYEGNTARLTLEMPHDADDQSAICQAIQSDSGDGDGIYKVLDCTEVAASEETVGRRT